MIVHFPHWRNVRLIAKLIAKPIARLTAKPIARLIVYGVIINHGVTQCNHKTVLLMVCVGCLSSILMAKVYIFAPEPAFCYLYSYVGFFQIFQLPSNERNIDNPCIDRHDVFPKQ